MKTYTEEQCPVTLYENEAGKRGAIGFRAHDAWRTVGQDFSAATYPTTGVATHRVVPLVYRNEYGGLTVHRLNTAEYRSHLAAGSRSLALVNEKVCVPGYDTVPSSWNGGFGSDPCEVYPLGMIQPLQFPKLTTSTDLGTDAIAPWRGEWAFFYSLLYEDENGALSRYPLPRPPGSIAPTHPGLGYFKVGTKGHLYQSIKWTNIVQGPPGTRYIWLMRSSVVDTSVASGAMQPSVDDLMFCARIPAGTTTYDDTKGNDLSLDADPRLERMSEQQMAPPARYFGAFDGRLTEGCLRAHPGALWVMPWEDGAINGAVDSPVLYGPNRHYVAVTPTQVVLRKIDSANVVTDTAITITGRTIMGIADLANVATLSALHYYDGVMTQGSNDVTFAVPVSEISVGELVVSPYFPAGTVITDIESLPSPLVGATVTMSQKPLLSVPVLGASIGFEGLVLDPAHPAPWGCQPVAGADAEEAAENLLRTLVEEYCTYILGQQTIQLASLEHVKYLTPGMLVSSGHFPADTVVTAVDRSTGIVTVSHPAAAFADETVRFGYDTGDTESAGSIGFMRTFGNALPTPLSWNLDYLDQFRPALYASTFTAASPGYAQDALGVWMAGNRRGGRAAFGPFMGLAEVGPAQLQFFAAGRMRTANVRTGSTHIDEDYTVQVVSWTRGACSPYAICNGNLWAIFASDIGICACDAGEGEHLLSKSLYDPSRQPGKRGQLEYAIEASAVAAHGDTDEFKVFAQVIGSVLYVQYHSKAGLDRPDLEVRYDFSAGVGRTGLAEVLRVDGSPYPWSSPQRIGPSVSCRLADAEGIHRFAAFDTNAGATDGRVDEVDTGDSDNGVPVMPDGFSGVMISDAPVQRQALRARSLIHKAGTGVSVGIARNPERGDQQTEWDMLALPSSGAQEYGRAVEWWEGAARLCRKAEQYRISDDGSGDRPEVYRITIDAQPIEQVEQPQEVTN